MKFITDYPIEIIEGLPPKATSKDRVAIDTEIFQMDITRAHRPVKLDGTPNGKFASLACTSDGKTVYIIYDEKQVPEFLERIDDAVHIYMNAKFDITHIRRWGRYPQRKRLVDIMLWEQILYSGYYDGFSLADLVRRRLDCYLPKEEQGTFEDATEMNEAQKIYAGYDPIATWHVYKSQKEDMTKKEYYVWKNIELPFLWTLLGMSGIRLDIEKWKELAILNKEQAESIQGKYGHFEDVGKKKPDFVGILLSSPAQVKKELQRQGVKVKDKGKLKLIQSTGAAILESIKEENEFARDVLDFRTYSKRASTYGLDFIDKYVEADGRIYSDIFQIGAYTGRTSSRNPNQQNQINEPEYRGCYLADSEDDVLCVADWSSQEPRIAGYFSQDADLIDALNSKEKLYIRIARDALHLEIKKKSKEYSDIKSTILGIFYGMSPYGLSQRIGVTPDEAEEMILQILNTYPGIKDYMIRQAGTVDINDQHKTIFPECGYVETIYGRKIWLNPYDWGWARNALNSPIQGSAADAMKIAAYKTCEVWQPNFYDKTPLKLLVHDEIGLGVHKSGQVQMSEILGKVMVAVSEDMHPGIKAIAEVGCADNWADAK